MRGFTGINRISIFWNLVVTKAYQPISLTMQADIFGTQVQGSGFADANGNISGTINVLSVGPFIQAITHISGTFSNGIINATETVQYTDGVSGTEYFTAVRQ